MFVFDQQGDNSKQITGLSFKRRGVQESVTIFDNYKLMNSTVRCSNDHLDAVQDFKTKQGAFIASSIHF